MATAATSRKPDPIDTPHLFRRGGKFHYRRRVPEWLQPIVGTATWWAKLGTHEADARRDAATLSRRYDRLCSSDLRRLIEREGGADKVRDELALLALEPLKGPDTAILDGLHTAPLPVMRMSLALHSAMSAMAKSHQTDSERAAVALAPLTKVLEAPAEPTTLTVSAAAKLWLADIKPASEGRYAMVLRRLREVVGDPPITAVDHEMVWRFRDTIILMPGATGLPAAVRNASVPVQIQWMQDTSPSERPRTILPGAVENHLSVLRALFAWCLKRRMITSNPAADTDAPKDPRGDDAHHHAALAYGELPAFIYDLAKHDRPAAKALRFAILTAARTKEVMGADWSEIDLDKQIWTIPASRMKTRREHVIPLSTAALAVLGKPPTTGTGKVFGKLAQDALRDFLPRHMGRSDITVHGFRSTFRDWVAEETSHDPNAAEIALAHAVGSKVEAAYRRGNLFAKRRALMDDWAAFCMSEIITIAPHPRRAEISDKAGESL